MGASKKTITQEEETARAEYQAARKAFIKQALAHADGLHDHQNEPARWDRAFHRRMTELCVKAGLMTPGNLEIFGRTR